MAGHYDVYINMLFTYQGMGHLITLTEAGNAHKILHNALIDFGSTGKTYCQATVDWLYAYLTDNGRRDGTLDFVSISHKDKDHWSLFEPLLNKFDDPRNKRRLYINSLAIGDSPENYKKLKDGRSIVERLRTCISSGGEFKHFAKGGQSAYSKTKALKPLRSYRYGTVTEIEFMPVAVNVTTCSREPDIEANTICLVVAVVYGKISILLPGDATAETIQFINGVLAQSKESPLVQARMLSLPHHGSIRTIAANYNASKPDLSEGEKFAARIKPMTLGASAGFLRHHHPDIRVFELFKDSIVKDRAKHDFVAFYENKNQWEAHNTELGLYTTYLSVGEDGKRLGAREARIVFIVNANGDLGVATMEPSGQGGIGPRPRPAP